MKIDEKINKYLVDESLNEGILSKLAIMASVKILGYDNEQVIERILLKVAPEMPFKDKKELIGLYREGLRNDHINNASTFTKFFLAWMKSKGYTK